MRKRLCTLLLVGLLGIAPVYAYAEVTPGEGVEDDVGSGGSSEDVDDSGSDSDLDSDLDSGLGSSDVENSSETADSLDSDGSDDAGDKDSTTTKRRRGGIKDILDLASDGAELVEDDVVISPGEGSSDVFDGPVVPPDEGPVGDDVMTPDEGVELEDEVLHAITPGEGSPVTPGEGSPVTPGEGTPIDDGGGSPVLREFDPNTMLLPDGISLGSSYNIEGVRGYLSLTEKFDGVYSGEVLGKCWSFLWDGAVLSVFSDRGGFSEVGNTEFLLGTDANFIEWLIKDGSYANSSGAWGTSGGTLIVYDDSGYVGHVVQSDYTKLYDENTFDGDVPAGLKLGAADIEFLGTPKYDEYSAVIEYTLDNPGDSIAEVTSGDMKKFNTSSDGSTLEISGVVKKGGTYKFTVKTEMGAEAVATLKLNKIGQQSVSDEELEEVEGSDEVVSAPKVTFSDYGGTYEAGQELEIVMYTDQAAKMTFNGVFRSELAAQNTFKVTKNGVYSYSAANEDGKTTSGNIRVTGFAAPAKERVVKTSSNGASGVSAKDISIVRSGQLPQTGEYNVFALAVGVLTVLVGVVLVVLAYVRKRGGRNA